MAFNIIPVSQLGRYKLDQQQQHPHHIIMDFLAPEFVQSIGQQPRTNTFSESDIEKVTLIYSDTSSYCDQFAKCARDISFVNCGRQLYSPWIWVGAEKWMDSPPFGWVWAFALLLLLMMRFDVQGFPFWSHIFARNVRVLPGVAWPILPRPLFIQFGEWKCWIIALAQVNWATVAPMNLVTKMEAI